MSRAGTPVMPPGPRGPRNARPPARRALAVAIALSGRSYADIGRACGCAASTISRSVIGTFTPGTQLQHRVAALLGFDDVEALFAVTTDRLSSEALSRVVASVQGPLAVTAQRFEAWS